MAADRKAVVELIVRSPQGAQLARIKKDAADTAGIQREINEQMRKGNTVTQGYARSTAELAESQEKLRARFDRNVRSQRSLRLQTEQLDRAVENAIINERQRLDILRQIERQQRDTARAERARQVSMFARGATPVGGTVGRGAALTAGIVGTGVGVGGFAGLAGGFAAFRGTQAIIEASNEIRVLEGRIQDATRTTGDFRRVYAELERIAQRTFTPLDASVTVFQRLATARNDLSVTNDEILRIVENVQMLGVISGANQQQLRAGLIQLAQSFASQVVRAEEMNSILENIPSVARLIAQEMGVSVGTLRVMVTEGEVSSKQFADILKSVSATAQAINRFRSQTVTAARAGQQAATSWQLMASELDKLLGTTESWVETLQAGVRIMDSIRFAAAEINENSFLRDLIGIVGRAGLGTVMPGYGAARGAADLLGSSPPGSPDNPLRITGGTIPGPTRGEMLLGRSPRRPMSVTPNPLLSQRDAALERPAYPTDTAVDRARLFNQNRDRIEREQREQEREAARLQRENAAAAREAAREAAEAERERIELQREHVELLIEAGENQAALHEQERERINQRLGDMSRVNEAIEEQKASTEAFENSIAATTARFAESIVMAKLWGNSVKEAAAQAARVIIQQMIAALIRALILMAITSMIPGGQALSFGAAMGMQFGMAAANRASGGRMRRGNAYRVAEQGPELYSSARGTYMMAPENGWVTANNRMGGGNVNVHNYAGAAVSVDNSGPDTEIIIEAAVARTQDRITRDVSSGYGPVSGALKASYGPRRAR